MKKMINIRKWRKYAICIAIITILFLIDIYANDYIKSLIFSISTLIKELILFILPFAIFLCILSAILKLGTNAIFLIIILFIGIFTSNFLMNILAYFPSILTSKILSTRLDIDISDHKKTLDILFDLNIENPITPIIALAIAFILAFYLLFFRKKNVDIICNKSQIFGKAILNKMIIPLVPFFIFGFIVKILHEQLFLIVIKMLPIIVSIWVISSMSYALILYAIFTKGRLLQIVKNITPSFLIGMVSMSSNIAMPSLLNGINKTLKKETDVTNTIIAPTLNFHFVGDAFLIPIISIYVYTLFNDTSIISFIDYIWLAFVLAMIRFSNVAIPGGGAIIASPYLQNAPLNFDSEMSTLVITIYIVVDFLNTALNLFGNGAFIIGMNKIYYKFIDKKPNNKLNI